MDFVSLRVLIHHLSMSSNLFFLRFFSAVIAISFQHQLYHLRSFTAHNLKISVILSFRFGKSPFTSNETDLRIFEDFWQSNFFFGCDISASVEGCRRIFDDGGFSLGLGSWYREGEIPSIDN